jgi:hypothetical protein
MRCGVNTAPYKRFASAMTPVTASAEDWTRVKDRVAAQPSTIVPPSASVRPNR